MAPDLQSNAALMRIVSMLTICLLVACVACSEASSPGAPPDASPDAAPLPVDESLLAARPYSVTVPPSYDSTKPAPLLLLLHGYGPGDDGDAVERYFGFEDPAKAHGMLYVHPNGLLDSQGNRFWYANDYCCDFEKKRPDDVAYLRTIIGDVARTYSVDRKRIYVVGLSAGGMMAHRFACEAADLVAAFVSLSGTLMKDASRCAPSEPVHAVEVHGDADDTVKYAGGRQFGVDYASAHDTVAQWSVHDGCKGPLALAPERYDLDTKLAGPETHVERYASCDAAAELWTIEGGAHAPSLGDGWRTAVFDFLAAHPKK